MSDRAILVHANRIHELSERLDIAAFADGIQPEQLVDAKIVRDAQAQVRALRAFVKLFGA